MNNEPTLDDVYRKFGEVAEAAQLLETALGNLLLIQEASSSGLFEESNPDEAARIMERVNRSTLGQLLCQLQGSDEGLDKLEAILRDAQSERNRLNHSFYRLLNFRRNSCDGRALMVQDLESMHAVILNAYKAVTKLSGVDLDTLELDQLPSGHVPI